MPSTPTTSLRLEMQGTGENTNTWGYKLNSSTIILIDSAIAGRTYIDNPYSGQALSSVNYSTDQARQPVLQFSGTISGSVDSIITVPAVPKMYWARDYTAGANLQLGVIGGTSVTLPKSGYMPVTVTASGVEDARVYELSSSHVPTNPGGIVTRSSLGLTLSGTGMPSGYTPLFGSSVVTYSTVGLTLSSTGMPAGYTPLFGSSVVTYSTVGLTLSSTGMPSTYSPINNTSVTTKAYVDASILAAQLSGTLPGQSGNAGKYLATDGTNATWSGVLPSQTGNSGKFLVTDGTTASWSGAVALGRHTIFTRATAWTARTTSGASTAVTETATPNYNNIDGYNFISSANQYIQTEITPPVSYSGPIIPVSLEFVAFSASGNVYWAIQGVYVTSGGGYNQTYGTAATVTHAVTGSGLRQVTAEVNVTVSGTWVSGNSISWQIYRSAGGAGGLIETARLRAVNMYPTVIRATDAP